MKKPKQNCFLSRKRIRLTFFVVANSGKKIQVIICSVDSEDVK